MKRILKYRLPRDGEVFCISANVWKWLEVHEQDGWPHIWAIVDDEGQEREYEIVAWGTGWDWPEEMNWTSYLGTCIDFAGYVWHYFMQETTPATLAADRVYDYDYLGTLTGSPVATDYTITISCGEPDSAVSGLTLNKVNTDTKTTIDALQGWVESVTAAVSNSNTATLRACT